MSPWAGTAFEHDQVVFTAQEVRRRKAGDASSYDSDSHLIFIRDLFTDGFLCLDMRNVYFNTHEAPGWLIATSGVRAGRIHS